MSDWAVDAEGDVLVEPGGAPVPFRMTEPGEKRPLSDEQRLANLNRSMPFSDEAEKGVLSGVLSDPAGRLSECRISLPAEAFYHPANRMIYEALLAMLDACAPIEISSVTHWLRSRGQLDKCGGGGAISQLYSFIPISVQWQWHLGIVQKKFKLRQVINAAAEFIHEAQTHGTDDPNEGVDGLLASCQERMIALTDGKEEQRVKNWASICADIVDDVEEAFAPGNKGHIPLSRIATGFTSFDRRTGGLEGGTMFVIGARPSMGKTAFAMNIVENVALGEGHYHQWNHPPKPVLVFSLEMSARALGRRSIVGGAGVNLNQVRFGLGSVHDKDNITIRFGKMCHAKIFVCDCAALSIEEQRSIARIMVAKHGIKLVVSDYLQLATSESKKAKQNRALEIGEISHGYKAMAKELDIPVIVLAQLNRNTEERKGGKPKLSDLREGGDIEQDADIVGLLHRTPYYDENAPEDEAELIIAKGRDIGVGEVPLRFVADITRFESLTDSLLSNDPEKRDAGSKAQQEAQAKRDEKPARKPFKPNVPPRPQPQNREPQQGEFMPAPHDD